MQDAAVSTECKNALREVASARVGLVQSSRGAATNLADWTNYRNRATVASDRCANQGLLANSTAQTFRNDTVLLHP
jgi:hypothetical protein